MSIAGAAAVAMATTASKLPSPLQVVAVKPVSMNLILGLFTLALLLSSSYADEDLSSDTWETPPVLETFTSYEDMQRYFDHRNQRRLRHIENPLKDSYIEAYNQHNEQEELRTKRAAPQQPENKPPPALIKFEVSDAVEPTDEVKQLIRQYKSRQLQQNEKYMETIPSTTGRNFEVGDKPSNVISKQKVFGKRLERYKRSATQQQQPVNFKVKYIPFEVTDAREPDAQTKRLIKRMRALEIERLATASNRNNSMMQPVVVETTTTTTKKPFAKRSKFVKQWKPKRIRREAAAPEMIKFEISDAKDPDPALKTFMNSKRESKDLKLEKKSDMKAGKPADADSSEQNSQASKRYFVFKEGPTKVKKSIAAIPHDVQNIISHLIKGGGGGGGGVVGVGGKAYLKYIPAQQMDYNNLKAAYPIAKGVEGLYGHGAAGGGGGGGGGGGYGYGHGYGHGGGSGGGAVNYGKYAHAVPVKFVYHPVVVGAIGGHGGGYQGGGGEIGAGGHGGGGHGGAGAAVAVPVKYVAVGGDEAGYGGGGGGGEGGHGGGYGYGGGGGGGGGEGVHGGVYATGEGGYGDGGEAAKYVATIAAEGGGGGGYEGGGGHAVAYAGGQEGNGYGGGKGGHGAAYVAAAAPEEAYAAGGEGGGHGGGYGAAGGHGIIYGLAHGAGLGAHANYAGIHGGGGEAHAGGGGGGYFAAHAAPPAIVHPIVVAEGGGAAKGATAYGAGLAEAPAAKNAGNEAIKAIPAPQFKGEIKYSVVPTVEQYAKTATQDFHLKLYSPESLLAKAQLIAKDQAKAIAEEGQKAVAAAYSLAAGKGAALFGGGKDGYGGGGGASKAEGYGGAEGGFGSKIAAEGLAGGKGGGGGGGYVGGGGGGAGPVIKIEYHAPAESFKGNYKDIPEFQQLSALVGKSPEDQIHGLTYLLAKEMQNRLHLQRQHNFGGGNGGGEPVKGAGGFGAGKAGYYDGGGSGGGGAEVALEARPQDNKAPVLFQPQEAEGLGESLAAEGGKGAGGGGGGGGGGYYQPIVGKYLGMAKSKPYIPVIEASGGEELKGAGGALAAKGGGGGGKVAGGAYGLSPNYKGLGGLKGFGAGAGAGAKAAVGGGEIFNANAYEEAAAKLQSYASKYAFGYRIRDFNTGNDFGHKQNRDLHGVTRGQYHILLPDGRIQNVIYHADDTGFHADVSFESGRR